MVGDRHETTGVEDLKNEYTMVVGRVGSRVGKLGHLSRAPH